MLPITYNPFTGKLDVIGSTDPDQPAVPVEFRVADGYLQYKDAGTEEWINLIAISELGGSGISEATSPLVYDSNTKVLSISSATASTDGTLSATDKTKLDNLATVATTGSYNNLIDRPSLGTASSLDFAPAGNANTSQVVRGNDTRLSDAREWTASTVSQADAEAGVATDRRAWTVQRVWQAINSWWNGSASKIKLDGIASGATVNQTDAFLLSRTNHTGTQSVSTITGLGNSALLNVGSSAGTVTAGDDSRFADLANRLNGFRDSRRVYVSPSGNNSNNGTSLGEPLQTLAAAAAIVEPGDLVVVGPGTYTETSLPIRWKRDVGIIASSLRNSTVKPAAGQEMNDIFKVDSGFWCWGLEFAGHQANSTLGQQAWAISFDELADNRNIGAVGLGAYIFKSPYIQNCSSITAEDDSGVAGSQSTGDTGGGINVDGSKCAVNSPIRSMVVDSYTQVNLGGPGCLVQNDGYAQLVSFFGTFCQYHVKTLTGGQVNLSGGGTTDFGVYGLIADGYSLKPVFTGKARTNYYGASRLEKTVTINNSTDVFTANNHGLALNDQIKFSATQGTLPAPLSISTVYYVISSGLTSNEFKVSTSIGGAAVNITGTTDGTYQFVRQGATELDVLDFSANRLGRQIKYPTAGSLGSAGNAVNVTARGGATPGSTFTVTLATSTIKHEYTGGGTVIVAGIGYVITSAVYNHLTGVTVLTASGYAPTIGDSIVLAGLSFICNSISRPSAGQLLFPQLVFPRNATTGIAEAKTFTYTKTGNNILTFTEAASASGPDHEYVSGGTIVIGSIDYGVTSATYNKTTGLVTITTVTTLPGSIGASGSVTVNGLSFICPTSAYVITSSIPIDSNGNTVANDSVDRAGYRVLFYSSVNGGLLNPITTNQILDFRQRSQISAPSHTFEYVGSGTNYDALPWNGGVPVAANKIVELNNGRVYSSNTDELGNFAVGSQFSVDGTTGSVTINTNQFNLSGVNFIGPFSRNGGISTVGEQLREVSNNTSLIASTGAPDGNTAPTQFAVKTYTDNRFLNNVTVTSNLPLTITDTSTQDGQGYWTRTRNLSLSINTANGLARLDGNALIPASILPNTDSINEGTTNLYFTQARARQSISATGSLSYNNTTGIISYTAPSAADVFPSALGVAAIGVSSDYAREDHVHAMPSATDVGAVSSVALATPTGLTVSGSPITSSGTITINLASGYSIPTTAKQTDWDTAFTERLRWDGGTNGLNATTARTSLGLGNSAVLNVGTTTATVAAGDDSRFTCDLNFDASTRLLTSSTGADVTLPLFTSILAGLVPGSGGGTTNFLRADGSWAAPVGSVTSVGLTAPTGFSVSGSPITTSGSITLSFASGYSLPTTASQSSWDTAHSERRQWDGGSTNLNAATARTSLGLGTLATQSGTFSGTSSGTNTGDQTISLTGDVTGSGTGSFAATLASTAVTPGSYGAAGSVASFTVDAKGRLTAASNVTISIASTAISDSTAAGRSLLTAADAAAQRTALSLGSAATSATTDFVSATATQSANVFLAGPTSGAAAAPTFRALVSDDLPNAVVTYAKIQNVTSGRLLGRTAAGAGAVNEITVGEGLILSSGTLSTQVAPSNFLYLAANFV